MSLIELVRKRVHRTCTELITTQHDAVVAHAQARHEAEVAHRRAAAEADRLDEALSESAEAHAEAEEALSESRATVERLTGELAAARADADQADAARRAMVQALAAVMGGDDDAEQRIQDLRQHGDLRGFRDEFFELWAIRSALEHFVACPDATPGEHLGAAARRLVERTDRRSREVRELADPTPTRTDLVEETA